MTPELLCGELNIKVTEVKDIIEAVSYLLACQSSKIAIFDYDFTLKTDYLDPIISMRLGIVPRESVQVLKMLRFAGWHVCVLTNQHPEGHIIARQMSHLRGNYPFFPDSLEKVMRNGDPNEELVLGNRSSLYFPFYKYKNTSGALDEVCKFINRHRESAVNGIFMLGDRQSDISFANRLNSKIKNCGLSVNEFFKFPDPPHVSLFPRSISNIMP